MPRYLLIESRDPFGSAAVREHLELAVALRQSGSDVALYLVQNGVLPCRPGADCAEIHEALAAGVEVLADEHSLRERGIRTGDIARGARPVQLELVIDRLAGGWKTLFL